MPELDIVTMATCRSNVYWKRVVTGSKGDNYTIRFEAVNPEARLVTHDYTCECPDFQIRRAHLPGQVCKHISRVKSERCGWSELVDGSRAIEGKYGKPVCPRCKGPVEYERVGV